MLLAGNGLLLFGNAGNHRRPGAGRLGRILFVFPRLGKGQKRFQDACFFRKRAGRDARVFLKERIPQRGLRAAAHHADAAIQQPAAQRLLLRVRQRARIEPVQHQNLERVQQSRFGGEILRVQRYTNPGQNVSLRIPDVLAFLAPIGQLLLAAGKRAHQQRVLPHAAGGARHSGGHGVARRVPQIHAEFLLPVTGRHRQYHALGRARRQLHARLIAVEIHLAGVNIHRNRAAEIRALVFQGNDDGHIARIQNRAAIAGLRAQADAPFLRRACGNGQPHGKQHNQSNSQTIQGASLLLYPVRCLLIGRKHCNFVPVFGTIFSIFLYVLPAYHFSRPYGKKDRFSILTNAPISV